ncbi:MAG: hypothetical protein HC939_19070 [Pleurocapsa sp. SU_5_0]|nr:hypothetical protein [Pleurocapsa sp. SU_5_0]
MWYTASRRAASPLGHMASLRDYAWVHAYLHRVEGDLGNARYWYRRSGRSESTQSLTEERQQITQALLKQF